MEPIIVVAGTPVDTRMGVELLEKHGLKGIFTPTAQDPYEQQIFQNSPVEEKKKQIIALLEKAKKENNTNRAFIYCNSLSGAVNFKEIAKETGMKIVTPRNVYELLAPNYMKLAVLTANAYGSCGIEETMHAVNHAIHLFTIGIPPMVHSVEDQIETPDEIVEHFRLPELISWTKKVGAEAVILGCTHFPFFKDALAPKSELPLIDPSEEMVRLIQE